MFTYATNGKKRRPLSWIVSAALLSLVFLWAFLGTIDGPTVNLGIAAGSVVCKTPHVLDSKPCAQPGPLWFGAFPEEPPTVHTSFFLFDFKQNLRRWPNVAGDISRSPPSFLAI